MKIKKKFPSYYPKVNKWESRWFRKYFKLINTLPSELLSRARRLLIKQDIPVNSVYDFKNFINTANPKNALICYLPSALHYALNSKKQKYFNPHGIAFEMSRSLNELGYIVDMIPFMDQTFVPAKNYDLIVSHGNASFKRLNEEYLTDDILKITFATGSHWRIFVSQSEERYKRFSLSRGIEIPKEFNRPIVNSDYICENCDLLVTLGETTADTFIPFVKKVISINNASYCDIDTRKLNKNFEIGRNNFVFFCSNGNIQKGLDLLIEAFARTPELNLFINAALEEETIQNYRQELNLKNIFYTYPYIYRSKNKEKLLLELLNNSNFTILTGMMTGQSTAFINSMSYGMIPVANQEADFNLTDIGFVIPSNNIDDIIKTIKEVSKLEVDVYRSLSEKTINYHNLNHQPEQFGESFKKALLTVL